MKTIFITEKPLVAQEYRKVLKVQNEGKKDGYIEGHSSVINKDVIITWAVGHLIGICSPEQQNETWGGNWCKEHLPMIPSNFKYSPLKNTYSQYKIVKSLYTRPDIECIYYAGDSGREGIYIQALIRNQIFKTTPKIDEKVVWIDSYTEEAILGGIKNAKPYSSYQPMIDSGYMRAISDWLIGMNFTEGFTVTSGTKINVGRVMTPTLAMIVKRQDEIDHFVKTPYYGIKADNFAFWKAIKGSKYFESDLLYNEVGFIKKQDAENLICELNKSMKLTVSNVKVQQKTEFAPYLFNLADLQATCSKRFKISPADALANAQSLYEKKFTTYPRTDCRFLSSAVAKELKSKKNYNIPDRYVDDSKITDHYAIIPTFEGDTSSLSGMELKVYNLILKRFMDIMMPPFIYDAVSIIYKHDNGECFFESFRKIKQLGYKEKEEKSEDEDDKKDNEDDENAITDKPIPKEGTVISVSAFNLKEQETKPPVPYTTGTLILAMEKAGKLIEDEELREQIKTSGIGTSATRAAIIEKLQKIGHITVDKKQKIAPTDFGKKIIPLIEKYDEALISPVKTADMENKLSAIASNELSKEQYQTDIEKYVKETVKSVLTNNTERLANPATSKGQGSSEIYNCPCCGSEIKYGKFGWYCSNKDNCKFSLKLEICGHKMKEQDLKDLITKGKTKELSFKSPKTGKDFKAKLVLNKQEQKTDFDFGKSK